MVIAELVVAPNFFAKNFAQIFSRNAALENQLLQNVQSNPRVAVRKVRNNFQRRIFNAFGLFSFDSAQENFFNIGGGELVEANNFDAAQKRRIDFKKRIFRRGANQNQTPVLDVRQKEILLRLVEAVNFVDKKNRAAAVQSQLVGGVPDNIAQFPDAGKRRVDFDETGGSRVSDNFRQRSFTRARRAEKNHRRNAPFGNHAAQTASDFFLPDEISQILRTQFFSQRLIFFIFSVVSRREQINIFHAKILPSSRNAQNVPRQSQWYRRPRADIFERYPARRAYPCESENPRRD